MDVISIFSESLELIKAIETKKGEKVLSLASEIKPKIAEVIKLHVSEGEKMIANGEEKIAEMKKQLKLEAARELIKE